MPKLKEIEIKYDQIKELVFQLDLEQKLSLIYDITKDKKYRENFYAYAQNIAKKIEIPDMTEEELDDFLHESA
ncbi:MAG: hypothetical protein FXF49_02675 [Flexistipes sinusarabici]|uniref:Uncharacterized protein n=1 Tax=Flexistipes sinusarabici TaxID=2352 RepID=A0A5D0MQ81_FLESI|nr:hypothetical protein [Flexistipes sinusarabici]TYB34245.1 MAG: hypothetical protein FXF49_02675 [Flexistipes sinusarabici]